MSETKVDRRNAMWTMVGISAAVALGMTATEAEAASRKKDGYLALGRALCDAEFREKLAKHPAKTLEDSGLSPSAEQLADIKRTSLADLDAAAARLRDVSSVLTSW